MRTAPFVLVALLPAAAAAQQRIDSAASKPPGRTIVGIITDSSDRAIDSAEVFIPALKRKTEADRTGAFRFRDVKPGKYAVAARRLGYYPQTREVVVTSDSGGVARFSLVPQPRGLPPVVTSAKRGGLSGVVGDTGWAAIKGAEVTVISTTRRAVTDSMGAFHIDLPAGRHMVRVVREGYASQMVSATIPRDSGRRMMVFLRPSTVGPSATEDIAILETEMRLARRNPVYSTLLTREDINKGPWTELSQIAQSAATRPLPPECLAWIDGGPKREYIWAIRASEIEAVEIHRARPVRAEVRTITGGGRAIGNTRPIFGVSPGRNTDCPDEVFVWLRK
jgi:hypothetical protein